MTRPNSLAHRTTWLRSDLHFVGAELVDVAKGRIVQPGNHVFHGNPMPPTLYWVELVWVLPGCDELLPPI